MAVHISHTTVDCSDAYALSEWWKPVLGYTDLPDDPNLPGHEECMIIDPRSGHRLLFIEVPDRGVTKNSVHFDLASTDGSRDHEVERITALGATLVADRRNPDGTGWVTLADPEGNQFCVVRSEAERAAQQRE